MSQRYRLTRAMRELTPLRQGDLDGLCGLYAVINAIRIVIHPHHRLRDTQLKSLFAAGIGVVSRARRLPAALRTGIYPPLLLEVAMAISQETNRIFDIALSPAQLGGFHDGTSTVRTIKLSLRRGHPVIIGLEGRHDHWTVIASYTAARLRLFDSIGMRWISPQRIMFETDIEAKIHMVSAEGLLAIRMPGANPE